jgi:type I restriction enzyme S subunit
MAELYTLPDGWEWKKLGDISKKIFAGGDKPEIVSEFKTDDLNIPIYANAVKDNGLYGYSNIYKVDEECITISARGTIGFTVVRYEKFLPIVRLIVVIPNEQVLSKVLKYYLDYELVENTGSSIPQLTVPTVKELFFPLPPLEEQKRIVAKLDNLFAKIDKAIDLHKKNIDEANVFMASVLNDVFVELDGVYEKRQLESFDRKMSSGGTPSRKEKSYWENGTIDWFSSGELNQLYTLPSKEKITQLGLEKTSTKLFSKGTLLIGMYDTAAMKMSILSNDGSCNQSIVGFKSDESELNILFLKYQLEYLKKDILEQRQGVRQQNLNLSKIKNIEIEYPPLKTQQKVVSYLDEISQKMEKIKQIQKEKMQSLKALKASILDQAFKGEL